MKRYAISVLFGATALVSPAMTHGSPCWIERALQTPDGVVLRFMEGALFRITIQRQGNPGGNEEFVVQHGVPLLLTPSGGKETEIVLSPSDEARAFEMHSSCVLHVEKQGDATGVAAELDIYLPGRTSTTQKVFIVAE